MSARGIIEEHVKTSLINLTCANLWVTINDIRRFARDSGQKHMADIPRADLDLVDARLSNAGYNWLLADPDNKSSGAYIRMSSFWREYWTSTLSIVHYTSNGNGYTFKEDILSYQGFNLYANMDNRSQQSRTRDIEFLKFADLE